MARRKISTTVYITHEQERELKALHGRTKVPIAEYIRQGIDMVLNKHQRHLPGQLDLYRDHLSVVSEASEGLRKAAEEKRLS